MAFGIKASEAWLLAIGATAYFLLFRTKDIAASLSQSPEATLNQALVTSQPPTVGLALNAASAASNAIGSAGGALGSLSQSAISNPITGPILAKEYTVLNLPAPSTNKEISAQMSLLPAYRYG